MDQRKNPTADQIKASMILDRFEIPHEHGSAMSTEQILSLVHVDHDPVPYAIARDLGWTPEQYNHPSNLTVRLRLNHLEKTRKMDIPAIRKSDRVRDKHQEHLARLRQPVDVEDGTEPEQHQRSTRPQSKLRIRNTLRSNRPRREQLPLPMRKE